MKERIYFYTKQFLDKGKFEDFCRENFKSVEFIWVSNFYDYIIDNNIDEDKTYISLETLSEGFKFHYSVFDNNFTDQTLREQIEILKKLAQKLSIEILFTDDEINPWSWVLIESNGQTSTIETKDDDDILIIDNFYNFPFGDFRTQIKLNDIELKILKRIITSNYANIDIHYRFDGPVINGDFNKVKNNFEQLIFFDNHYEIIPIGKNEWLDKNEKSELFIKLMLQFREQVNRNLCLFPSNYSEIKNIEGGSDSEKYCLAISKGKVEKIIYKQRRKSWINDTIVHNNILPKAGQPW
ncbi:MAG: hypothetical protein WBP45_08565 [Daejeonella sp.]